MRKQIDIEKLFARVSQLSENQGRYHTQKEWSMIGAKKLLKKIGWRIIFEPTKTLDEMAQLLYETGIVKSIEEGKNIVPQLNGKDLTYKEGGMYGGELGFKKVNENNQEKYRVHTFAFDI